MPYVTSIERDAEQRGWERGFKEGLETSVIQLLLPQLTRLCGPLPEDMQQRVRQLSLSQSLSLGEDLLDFESLVDLQTWLVNQGF